MYVGLKTTRLEKHISCKSSDLIDQIVIVESSEAKGSEDSSDSVNSEILRTLNSIMMLLRLRFYWWQKIHKKLPKLRMKSVSMTPLKLLRKRLHH